MTSILMGQRFDDSFSMQPELDCSPPVRGLPPKQLVDAETQYYISTTSQEVLSAKQYNVLILGESQVGKTTFQRVLRNISYVTKEHNLSGVDQRSTVYKSSLFSLNGQYILINTMDAPGFAKTSIDTEGIEKNFKSVVAECVSRGISEFDLILITVNGQTLAVDGMTAEQIENITKIIKFLGWRVAPRTCLLVTHFESQGIEDEKKWISKFTSCPNMRFLAKTCFPGGFLFSGALNKNQFRDVSLRDFYTVQQRRRNIEFFKKLINGGTVDQSSTPGSKGNLFRNNIFSSDLPVHGSII